MPLPGRSPNNLPYQLTSFVGRGAELIELRELLGSTRLLTSTGAGGCGKTRLALHVGTDTLDRYREGGVWWVELAALAEDELVDSAVATALGVRPLPGRSAMEAALDRLGGSRALVLLDNCEHLLGAAAQVAEGLLRGCPNVTAMVTSRAPLGVGGETRWRVPSLSLQAVPGPEPPAGLAQSDAVRLFIERASKVRPNFAVSADNAPAIARICRELDGIPLAIELAAARVRVLSTDQIAAELGNRFGLLTGGARTALPRHQTLRASVDWSHGLLSDEERVLFRRLPAFAGGWTTRSRRWRPDSRATGRPRRCWAPGIALRRNLGSSAGPPTNLLSTPCAGSFAGCWEATRSRGPMARAQP